MTRLPCPKNIAVSFPLRHQSRNAPAQKKIATTSVNGCSPLSVGLVSRKKGIVSFAAEERQPRPQSTPVRLVAPPEGSAQAGRSEEHTSELQSLMRISYAVFCLKKKKKDSHPHASHNVRSCRQETDGYHYTTSALTNEHTAE